MACLYPSLHRRQWSRGVPSDEPHPYEVRHSYSYYYSRGQALILRRSEQSQSCDLSGFVGLLCECIHESLEEYEQAADEQREREEWARSIAERLGAAEERRTLGEYEVWKSALDLLRSYMSQTATLIDPKATLLAKSLSGTSVLWNLRNTSLFVRGCPRREPSFSG